MSTKTAINFMTDPELKKQFYAVTREMSIPPSTALNILMKKVVITRSIHISLPEDELEVENINISDWSEDSKAKIEVLNKKAKKIFTQLEEQGKL